MRFPVLGDRLTLLVKPVDDRCNIDCLYCYDKRRPIDRVSVSLDCARLRAFLERTSEANFDVVLHGGEPLLYGRDEVRRLLSVLRGAHNVRSVSIQTNGLLIDRSWCQLLSDFGVGIAISWDGPGSSSGFRIGYDGLPTGDAAFEAIRLASEFAAVSVISVVSSLTKPVELVDALASIGGVASLKLTPCLDMGVEESVPRSRGVSSAKRRLAVIDEQAPAWATTPLGYASTVREAALHWRNSGAWRRFDLEPLTSIVIAAAGGDAGYTDFSSRKQPFIVTMQADGSLWTSDEFESRDARLSEPEDADGLYEGIRQCGLWVACEPYLAACTGCDIRSICRGGNLADRLQLGDPRQESEYCDGRRELISSIAEVVGRSGPVAHAE